MRRPKTEDEEDCYHNGYARRSCGIHFVGAGCYQHHRSDDTKRVGIQLWRSSTAKRGGLVGREGDSEYLEEIQVHFTSTLQRRGQTYQRLGWHCHPDIPSRISITTHSSHPPTTGPPLLPRTIRITFGG